MQSFAIGSITNDGMRQAFQMSAQLVSTSVNKVQSGKRVACSGMWSMAMGSSHRQTGKTGLGFL